MDLQKVRKEYENTGIDEAEMPQNPLECLDRWFELAIQQCPGKWFEPNAMSLATSDSSGNVTVRVVLYKGRSDTGIQFFTNYMSAKGQQLKENPRASVVFHWPYLGRQVRMQGSISKLSRETSEEYFRSRPRGSQIGALASRQTQRLSSRTELEQVAEQLGAQYENLPIPLPEDWGGFLLTPNHVEFWQGRLNRLHDRIVYESTQGADWERFRLSP